VVPHSTALIADTFVLRMVLACAALLWSPVHVGADAIVFSSRAAFQAGLGLSVTDPYSHPAYRMGDVEDRALLDIHTDAQMSAIVGETRYASTGRPNGNIIFEEDSRVMYCAGCNGSFLLDFTSTTVGDSSGVYGVGFDFVNLPLSTIPPSAPYFAFVAFGNGTTADYLFETTPFFRFFGLASEDRITSLHVGLFGGAATTLGHFRLDDLTIGGAAVPEPGSIVLCGLGLASLAARQRRRAIRLKQTLQPSHPMTVVTKSSEHRDEAFGKLSSSSIFTV